MKTIAVIDDDVHIGDVLTEILENEGYTVTRAYSGTEALYLLSENKPDLILLDLMLPGLSGEEVLPRIKNIPVIVLSAKVDCSGQGKPFAWRRCGLYNEALQHRGTSCPHQRPASQSGENR